MIRRFGVGLIALAILAALLAPAGYLVMSRDTMICVFAVATVGALLFVLGEDGEPGE
jgi:hypothetical protein